MYLVTADEMREMDRQTIDSFGLPGRILMENAGKGAVRVLGNHFDDLPKKKIAVLAGRGNNGGDGFVMARYLSHMGANVTVYLMANASDVKGDAKANLNLLTPLHIPVVDISNEGLFTNHKTALIDHDILIDAILGTGLKTEVKGFFKLVMESVNTSGKPVFSVDIPSGLDADTGQPRGACVKAHVTATFAYPKLGHMLFPGASCTGALDVVNIGIPPHIAAHVAPRQFALTGDTVKGGLQPRPKDAHKGTTGHLLVVSGSTGKTGAAALTATAAMRSGAGLVTLGIPTSLNAILETRTTEVMTFPLPDDPSGMLTESSFDVIQGLMQGKACIAFGPGLGVSEGTRKLVERIIRECEGPLVIDADGLNCLEGNVSILKDKKSDIVLTPHPGEMARIAGTTVPSVQNDRVTCARQFAQSFNVHVVLKGAGTVIAHPDGRIFVNTTGNAGMASGGMGDVLTGILGSFVAQGYPPEAAAHMAVYIHGAAADALAKDYGPIGFLASDITDILPTVLGNYLC